MKIWLHRISHHAEVAYPLLEKGYLSIGFSDFSNNAFVNDICGEEGWNALNKYFDEMWGSCPKTRYNLWRFIAEMKEGDLVVVPSSGVFSVYELSEDSAQPISQIDLAEIKDWQGNSIIKKEDGLLYRKNGEKEDLIDLGFIRKVKLIKKDISRCYADSALTRSMKNRSTNADISPLKISIEKAIERFDENKPLDIYSQIIEKAYQPILNTIRTELNPDKFEKLVKWFFQRIGASEVYIPAKNEKGKEGDSDVVAVFEPIRTIIYSQVKFHIGETSIWAIEQIKNYKDQKEMMDDGYSKISWVISSADNFSQQSYAMAKQEKVQLVDGKQFATMLLEAGIVNLGKDL